MLREARTPKVHDWLVTYVVRKSPHAEQLRLAWLADPDPVVASAGWALTTERVAKKPEGLDLAGLLDVIEAEMKDAPERLQWAMNHCLAQIGIEHAEHRARAIDIGERLGCSRIIRLLRAARLRSRPSGSPRWCADSRVGSKPALTISSLIRRHTSDQAAERQSAPRVLALVLWGRRAQGSVSGPGRAWEGEEGRLMGALDEKTAVVTGASEGIGAATARRFAAEGATVFITGRHQAELDTAAKAINAENNGGHAIAVRGDVSVLDDLDRLYARVKDETGRIDVLFANAGVSGMARLEDVTEEHVDRIVGVNVRGLLFTVRKALPLLSDGASVILPSSIAASKGVEAFSVYNATKAAVRSFARTWAVELAPRRIRVNAVTPGPTRTPGLAVLVGDKDTAARFDEELVARIPLCRMGEPDEVAAAVLFLATDASRFTTGAEILVDGGLSQI